MEKQASLTALISSFGRAYHAEHDTPVIFHDRVQAKWGLFYSRNSLIRASDKATDQMKWKTAPLMLLVHHT